MLYDKKTLAKNKVFLLKSTEGVNRMTLKFRKRIFPRRQCRGYRPPFAIDIKCCNVLVCLKDVP